MNAFINSEHGTTGILAESREIDEWSSYRAGTIDFATMQKIDSMPPPKSPLVRNNMVTNADNGIVVGRTGGGQIVNNTLVGGFAQDIGIWMFGPIGLSYPSEFVEGLYENNAIVDYQDAGIKIVCYQECDAFDFTPLHIQYNNVWRNSQNYIVVTYGGQGGDVNPWPLGYGRTYDEVLVMSVSESDQAGKNGNISADPAFVNVKRGDYHEKSGSPHIDAGNPASDYSQEPEPNGGRINIGAYGNTAEATRSR